MNLLDVNVVLALFRADHPHHARARSWWDRATAVGETFTVPDVVRLGLCRIATDPRVFDVPATFEETWEFSVALAAQPTHLRHVADDRVLEHFARIAGECSATGSLLSDVYVAAVAASLDATVVTFDRDFRRFDGVRVLEPA